MTRAAVVEAVGEPFAIEDVTLDSLRPDEVRVRIAAVGVCHTDISVATGVTPFPLPGVLGHEGAGTVLEVGAAVTRTGPGDRVVLSFTSCGRCDGCRSGHPAYCLDHLPLNLLGGSRADGTPTVLADGRQVHAHFFGQSSFSEEAIADERSVTVLGPDLDGLELPELAPLGCGIQTGAGAVLHVLKPRPASSLVITGAGAVGLAAVMAASGMTAVERLIVVDRIPARLELARELGATHTINAADGSLNEALQDATAGAGIDYAVETTGVVPVLDTVIDELAVRGEVAVIGAPRTGSRGSFDVPRLLPGRTIRGVTLGDADPQRFIPFLARMYGRGRFPIDRLIERYEFADIARAVQDAVNGATVKPVLVF